MLAGYSRCKGNGNYDINILQTASFNGEFKDVAGKIEKGKMILYDPNLLTRPSANIFPPVFEGAEEKKLILCGVQSS